ncbi:23S rRNA (guanosine(2251)-2'-O)-methyltransferase RlmB [Desulfobulbus rhabdoformis]|uniref:23S rRNA (guanosine(2251)-2'-O)-methyltransferase RlmB n=1 Tax=Desulfobulbus rhabdoformis TaxID=34032 RepID=UPI001963FA6B|nr:23S rRNA (guanosine(2251)-2'-O)-methyltransferase RlmB [Desulfobulbus rhabdoformis]
MKARSRKKQPSSPVTEPQEAASEDLIWGINAVSEALAQSAGGGVSEILVQSGKAGPRLQQIIDTARERSIAVRFVDPARMRVPRTCRHQGVVARLSEAKLLDLDTLLSGLGEPRQEQAPKVLVLDSIQDPRNLGSILRSALAAGFSRIIMTRERSVPVTGTVARTSAGAVAHMQICRVVNLADTLNVLKERGFWIFGAVAEEDAASIYSTDFSGPVALVIGSEGKGIRPLVRKQCDHLVTIPMPGSFNSLNASVAAAVIMFEVARRSL